MATVDSLIIEIDASAESAGKKLDSFSSSLSRVAQECETVINRLKATKGTIQYEIAQFQTKGTGVPWIDKLKKQCEELSKMRLSSSWGNQMQRIRQEIEASKSIDTSGLQHIVDSFKPLTDIPKASGLNSAVNTLRKIPDMIEQMNGISSEKLDTFQQQIKDITGSISPLTAELATLADSYQTLPPPVQEAINANKRLEASNESTAKSSHSLLDSTIRLGAVLYGLRRVGDFAFGTFTKSNDFVEGLNLASITPANSLRMLSSQWGVAQRYMGQFVSVIAAQVIPIIQTMVAVIASAARALASLWGYALPSIPAISGASGAFGDRSNLHNSVAVRNGGHVFLADGKSIFTKPSQHGTMWIGFPNKKWRVYNETNPGFDNRAHVSDGFVYGCGLR